MLGAGVAELGLGGPRERIGSLGGTWCGTTVSRGKRRKADGEQERVAAVGAGVPSGTVRDDSREARALKRSWAQLIKRIYEVGPLVCPSCGSEMKVIAFITGHEVVEAILRHFERKDQRRERPAERAK